MKNKKCIVNLWRIFPIRASYEILIYNDSLTKKIFIPLSKVMNKSHVIVKKTKTKLRPFGFKSNWINVY